jgi:type III secretory pathway component EscU
MPFLVLLLLDTVEFTFDLITCVDLSKERGKLHQLTMGEDHASSDECSNDDDDKPKRNKSKRRRIKQASDSSQSDNNEQSSEEVKFMLKIINFYFVH